MFTAQIWLYLGSLYNKHIDVGMKLRIHGKDEPPRMAEYGMAVTPGRHVYMPINAHQVRAATDESQKTLNKCETRNKTVFDTRLRHPETINSVPLNSVLRIKQTCV